MCDTGFCTIRRSPRATKTHCYALPMRALNSILGWGISSLDAAFPTLKKNFQNGIRLLTPGAASI